jgi:hypothetical protein
MMTRASDEQGHETVGTRPNLASYAGGKANTSRQQRRV